MLPIAELKNLGELPLCPFVSSVLIGITCASGMGFYAQSFLRHPDLSSKRQEAPAGLTLTAREGSIALLLGLVMDLFYTTQV